MAYIRTKTIKGHEYYYEVESVREGDRVNQKHIRYIGKSLGNIGGPGGSGGHLSNNTLTRDNLKSVPNDKPGVYYLYNRNRNLVYVGRAGDTVGFGLRHRISAHYQQDSSRPEWEQKLSRNAKYFLFKTNRTDKAARALEREEIMRYKPRYNNYIKE